MTTGSELDQTGADVRPIVSAGHRRLPTWLLVGGVMVGGLALFLALDGKRRAASAPAVTVRSAEALATISTPPPLFIPSYAPAQMPPPPAPPLPPVTLYSSPPPPAVAIPATTPFVSAPTSPPPPFQPFPSSPQPVQSESRAEAGSPTLVIDTTTGRATISSAAGDTATSGQTTDAVRTERVRRPSVTVVQGTLIPAVLETALDSTRPGQARAVVSRDIAGFDGSRVLIPRGSRLIGNYEADLADGQSRAFVEWTRLVRPDGVTIALASPAADLQGRAGVPGRVNTHFLARFGSALLQTTLNLGGSALGRSIGGDSPVVVALPGATQNVTPANTGSGIRPTLRVAAGARVSVFVARDLEFASGTPR